MRSAYAQDSVEMVNDYIVKTPMDVPMWIVEVAELSTIWLSLIGMCVSLFLTFYFRKGKGVLAERLKCEYFTDFLTFVVLLLMGIGLYFHLSWLVKLDVVIRPFVVAANIYAMWRLYNHYRKL